MWLAVQAVDRANQESVLLRFIEESLLILTALSDSMRKDTQTDHRKMSEPAIKSRILDTRTGDEVRFNDKVKPLDVKRALHEEKEWHVIFRDSDGREWQLERQGARRNLDLPEVGETLDISDNSPDEVVDIEECGCPSCRDLDVYELHLEGPRGGKYEIFEGRNGIKYRHISGESGTRNPFDVEWFQNQTRT